MGDVSVSAAVELWRGRLARQGRSNLSISEFCRRERVSPASFYAWRKRLAESGLANSPPPMFVPVELAGVGNPVRGVEIELPCGAVVKLPAQASAELVVAAIRAALSASAMAEAPSC